MLLWVGGNSNIFLIFNPKCLGKMISKSTTVVYFKWVGSTTNYSWCLALVWFRVFVPQEMELVLILVLQKIKCCWFTTRPWKWPRKFSANRDHQIIHFGEIKQCKYVRQLYDGGVVKCTIAMEYGHAMVKICWNIQTHCWSRNCTGIANPDAQCMVYKQEHTPPNFIHQSRSPTIHPTKIQKYIFPQKKSKISKINSRMIFIQKYPRNYCSISSQIAYKFLLCFFVKMCFAKLHFLTVHLQTSHSISIWLYAFL